MAGRCVFYVKPDFSGFAPKPSPRPAQAEPVEAPGGRAMHEGDQADGPASRAGFDKLSLSGVGLKAGTPERSPLPGIGRA